MKVRELKTVSCTEEKLKEPEEQGLGRAAGHILIFEGLEGSRCLPDAKHEAMGRIYTVKLCLCFIKNFLSLGRK